MMKKALVAVCLVGGLASQAQAFGLGTLITLAKGKSHATAAAPYEPNAPRKEVTGKDSWEGFIQGAPIAGSPFEKLTIGMTEEEVKAIVGEPTASDNYTTSKAAIPGMGAGKQQNILRYKGLGRLFTDKSGGFSNTYYLVGIEYYAKETGADAPAADAKKPEEAKKE